MSPPRIGDTPQGGPVQGLYVGLLERAIIAFERSLPAG